MAIKALVPKSQIQACFKRISSILLNAREKVLRTINTEMVHAYWLIGKEIVEEEQKGEKRAEYGSFLLEELSLKMTEKFGKGYSIALLKRIRQFYLVYPKGATVSHQLEKMVVAKGAAVRHLFDMKWKLSWTHYRILITLEDQKRSFYEIEAIQNRWSARELERQICSLLFERLSKSKDKKGLLKLAKKGQEILTPQDAIKDPVILEFLNYPETHRLIESNLEESLISNLQHFLLELGKGFAFIARQKRLTLDDDHFYVDLVFYHTILKCYVLIDLKTAKLSHADLGQMQLYLNYFDQECRSEGDQPTIGLILCAGKNDAVVKYFVGQQHQRIFASHYKLHLPSEKELVKELRREIRAIKGTNHKELLTIK